MCGKCGGTFDNPVNKKMMKQMKWVVISFIAFMIIVGLLLPNNSESSKPGYVSMELRTKTIVYVKSQLRDPDSYQSISFGELGDYDDEGNKFFIHHFRAKNGYGGYTDGMCTVVVDPLGEIIDMGVNE